MNIRRIINEEIQKLINENFYNENMFDENSFFEKKKKKSSKEDKPKYFDRDSADEEKEEKKHGHKKSHKKNHKMASDSLMTKLRDHYKNNKEMIDLRASVAEVYGMSTDTTGSDQNTVKLNSRTRAVLAALNGEVRPDNGIPYSLRQDIAQSLYDLWMS